MYKIYRPSPLIRAYNLEKALDTPAKIYYKFEGNNTSGSHKLNSAIAQAYYAKEQGPESLTTGNRSGPVGHGGAGGGVFVFWHGSSGVHGQGSYEQKPFRKAIMQTFDARSSPAPTAPPKLAAKFWRKNQIPPAALGCAISGCGKGSNKR